MQTRRASLLTLALVAAVVLTDAYKPHDFKTCGQVSFCRRHRLSAEQNQLVTYTVTSNGLKFDGKDVVGDVASSAEQRPLKLRISGYKDGTFRLRIEEVDPKHPRFEATDALVENHGSNVVVPEIHTVDTDHTVISIGEHSLRITMRPAFKAELLFNGRTVTSLNERQYLRFEQYRNKEDPNPHPSPDDNDMFEESFGAHRDTKPHGPSSVGLDISHHGAQHVYGIPERATRLSLGTSRGEQRAQDEPYRLYNLDVFEFDTKNPHQPLYGAVPLILAHTETHHTGLLWLNPSETFIDVAAGPDGRQTHWFSESGNIDVFLMAAKDPKEVQRMYTRLTGPLHMPPLFAIAYHQCRWNYNDEADVKAVDAGFEEHDIPYDVLWLDIEHTDGKRYFTWDNRKFPDPVGLQNDLASRGRKMVVIIDPHLKNDPGFPVFQDAKGKGLYVKNKDGGDFEGHCWPGGSMWLDYMNPEVRKYWASRFDENTYKGSTKHLYTWNDMNEPSVFNGPEITMPKDNLHHNGIEHREIHNMYGFYMTTGTVDGHAILRPNQRSFVLSRSFFAGSQRHVAVWTGDNEASWDSFQITQPMLLTLGVTGIVFSGADIGGFFKNPDPELLVRWYQTAAFQPFMRAHAHIETARREPWLFGEENTALIRTAVRWRYQILPHLYTLFHTAHTDGIPVLRPMWMEFPSDPSLFATDDQFLLGGEILVKPAVNPGQRSTEVQLAGNTPWYDYFTGAFVGTNGPVTIDTPMDKIAAVIRGGSIITQRRRARRSSSAMVRDPYTLVVAADSNGQATGMLYMDDGVTHNHKSGESTTRFFKLDQSTLSSTSGERNYDNGCSIERVVILGHKSAPASVQANQNGRTWDVQFSHDPATGSLTLRKPELKVNDDFTVTLR